MIKRMKRSYVQVAMDEQNLNLQLDALIAAGCRQAGLSSHESTGYRMTDDGFEVRVLGLGADQARACISGMAVEGANTTDSQYREADMIDISLSFGEYKELVEQSPIMIWRAKTNSECDYFNQRWLAFTGRTMEQEVGYGWAEGIHPYDLERCLRIYIGAFPRHEIFEMEYRLRRHDGIYRWIFDRGVPFNDVEGNFAGYVGSCIDVTARIDAEEVLRKAQQAEVHKLRGLLPICASCKNIRDDQGYWKKIETYISEHSEAVFSHSLCPTCAKKLYPESQPQTLENLR